MIGPVAGDDGTARWHSAAYAADEADEADTGLAGEPRRAARGRRNTDAVRHAYYPGRRMNLGVVLLPLRVFLGFISIYAGMGKLCDPVYFDGGERGSMVIWLQSLHPWDVASPLRDFALEHPVGAGLTIAFSQVVVGVLTVFGLWQRLAASVGALLSAALLVTVSWRTVAAYDAPDIIYLAAWSPLIIAGAPVYSMDARLAGEAWRRLGPRVEVRDLRRRVLRRGSVLAAVITGLTLLIGSMLGAAVRSSDTVRVPGPSEPPTNHLPGKPLPGTPGASKSPGSRGPQDKRSGSLSAADGNAEPRLVGPERGEHAGRHRAAAGPRRADRGAEPAPGTAAAATEPGRRRSDQQPDLGCPGCTAGAAGGPAVRAPATSGRPRPRPATATWTATPTAPAAAVRAAAWAARAPSAACSAKPPAGGAPRPPYASSYSIGVPPGRRCRHRYGRAYGDRGPARGPPSVEARAPSHGGPGAREPSPAQPLSAGPPVASSFAASVRSLAVSMARQYAPCGSA